MFNDKKFFLTFLAMCCVSVQYAVIPELEIWSDGEHYRYFLKDYGVDYMDGRTTIKQREDILWAVKEKLPDAFIIVRDICDCTTKNIKVRAIFDEGTVTTFDGFLITAWRNDGICSDDTKGSMRILNGIPVGTCLAAECSCKQVPYYNVACEEAIWVFEVADDITEYDVLDDLRQRIEEFECGSEKTAKLNTILNKIRQVLDDPEQASIHFVPMALDVCSGFRVIRMLLKLKRWKDITHGFICMEDTHGKLIKDGLESLGYSHIKTIGAMVTWDRKPAEQSEEDFYKEIVNSSLDLRETFSQIFKEQQPMPFWERHQNSLFMAVAWMIIIMCIALGAFFMDLYYK